MPAPARALRECRRCPRRSPDGPGHAPGLADGLFATWHGNVAQMSRPLIPHIIADQEFTTPNCTIGAVAGTVKRHADHWLRQPMLRHAARHVRVMVLDADQRDPIRLTANVQRGLTHNRDANHEPGIAR